MRAGAGTETKLATAHAHIGGAKMRLGRAEDSEAHIQEALRLSPRDTLVYTWCTIAGAAKLYLAKEGGGDRLAAQVNRIQSKLSNLTFLFGRRFGASQAARGSAVRGSGRTCNHSDFYHRPVSRRRAERKSNLPRSARRVIEGFRKAGAPEQ